VRTFRTIWKWLVPGWLQEGEGELVQYAINVVRDAFAERSLQTVLLSMPSYCPEDALPFHGRDRAIPRGLFEPAESYRARLVAWRFPRGHRIRGNAPALLEQVTAALRGEEHQTIDARGTRYTQGSTDAAERGVTWDWDGAEGANIGTQWGRYWIVVKATQNPETWDDASNTEVWDDTRETGTWAHSEIHRGEIAAVRSLVAPGSQSWTPAGRRAIYLVIYFQGQSYPVPGGDWDDWTQRDPQYAYVPLHTSID
jgi:hypothetical protein